MGLARGGWLPCSLAIKNDTIVLPDRCVVTQIAARLQNGLTRNGLNKDFLDLIADSPIRINPLLFALEGNVRQTPTLEQARAQLTEAVDKLKKALPKAIIVADENVLNGVWGLIEDSEVGMTRKQKFLLRLAPSLASLSPERNCQIVGTKLSGRPTSVVCLPCHSSSLPRSVR